MVVKEAVETDVEEAVEREEVIDQEGVLADAERGVDVEKDHKLVDPKKQQISE